MTKRSIHMRLLLKRATERDSITAWFTQICFHVDNGVKVDFQSFQKEGMIGHARHASAICRNICMHIRHYYCTHQQHADNAACILLNVIQATPVAKGIPKLEGVITKSIFYN